MLLVKSVSHASSCPLRCRSCVCWLYLRHNILRKNIWVIYTQHIAYLQPACTYMCGKERERFLEIPSPDFTSLRSSPSGFADKVASVSESFGRVSECKITAFSWILQKKTHKVNGRYDNPLKQSVLSCSCCNFFVILYPPLPEQVYLIFVLTHRKNQKINKSKNQE